MGGVVTAQNPSACFSMSTLGPLQKLSFTFAASGAVNRICTRELLSTRGYCASRTFDVAGLKSPGSCAKQQLTANRNTIPNTFTVHLRAKHNLRATVWNWISLLSSDHWHGNPVDRPDKAIYLSCLLQPVVCIVEGFGAEFRKQRLKITNLFKIT